MGSKSSGGTGWHVIPRRRIPQAEDVERKTILEHLTLLLEQGRVVEEGGRYRAVGAAPA